MLHLQGAYFPGQLRDLLDNQSCHVVVSRRHAALRGWSCHAVLFQACDLWCLKFRQPVR